MHSQRAEPLRFLLSDQYRVRLELDAEEKRTGVPQDFEEIFAQHDLSTAQCQKKNACFRQLIKEVFDFRCSHLAMVFMVEIAMNTPFVAAVGEIQLNA